MRYKSVYKYIIDKNKELSLSPHYVKKSNTDEVGYFNGG